MSALIAVGVAVGIVVTGVVAGAGPAQAHGFSSVVYADVTSTEPEAVSVKLSLEYDLMLVSVATAENDDAFYRQGQPKWDDGDYPGMVAAVEDHTDDLASYLRGRLTVAAAGGTACSPTVRPSATVDLKDEVPYAHVVVDFACPTPGRVEPGHIVTSTLFADDEKFVTGTKTIVTYAADGKSGSATLDSDHPSFSTEQSALVRFREFFLLGAEHLLGGLDHILFLVALIAGSRRLREIVLAASAFTVAHSITFILAALGVVSPPAIIVEPVIALSIAAVAGWYLWRLIRLRSAADDLVAVPRGSGSRGHFSLDRAGWIRLAVVFAFGLVHGLGFAGALGIHEAFSGRLLVSLLIFNVGIEAVQLALIALVFPPLALLRRRAHRVSLVVTGIVTAGVFTMGMIWFIERLAQG